MDIFGSKVLEQSRIDKHLKKLNREVYSKVPKTKCLGCPSTGGCGNEVVAQCCRKASPPLYYIEFVNMYRRIKSTWSKSDIEALFYSAFELLFSTSIEKPCILLDMQTNMCKLYSHRCLNCRTYGMASDSEWVTRAKFWVKDVLKPKFTELKTTDEYVDSGIAGINGKPMKVKKTVTKNVLNEEALDQYVGELFNSDDFDPDAINQRLKADYGIDSILYRQCKNLQVDNPHMGLHNLYEKLVDIESSFTFTDIKKLSNYDTYMAFHLYLLLFVLGENKLETLISYSEKATEEQKQMFLQDIKKSLVTMAEAFCE